MAAILVMAVSVPAHAQSGRVGMRGFGGVMFMSETAGVFGLGAGVRVRPGVEVFGEAGRLTNALPHSLQRDLDEVARSFGTYFGAPLRIDGRAPAVYALGGVRLSRQAGRGLRVFVDAGAGVARGESDIRARAGGVDVSSDVARAIGVKASETAPAVEVGGGLLVDLSARVGLDVGYRYMRIFTDDPRINTASLTVGLRWALP